MCGTSPESYGGAVPHEINADLPAVRAAVVRQRRLVTPGIENMPEYHARQVHDESHREVIGPLLPATGASGVVLLGGRLIADWGTPAVPEMAYSATKSVVSTVAGVASGLGLLPDVDVPVAACVDLPVSTPGITWKHLLQQTSQWPGSLWSKPASVDAQSRGADHSEPGSAWAYNDVRVNLLCLALTALLGRPLPAVLREHVLGPVGASDTWRWHGYSNSLLTIDGRQVPVVSGGAHWGGGLVISAHDLALPAGARGAIWVGTCCGSTRRAAWSSPRTGALTSAPSWPN